MQFLGIVRAALLPSPLPRCKWKVLMLERSAIHRRLPPSEWETYEMEHSARFVEAFRPVFEAAKSAVQIRREVSGVSIALRTTG